MRIASVVSTWVIASIFLPTTSLSQDKTVALSLAAPQFPLSATIEKDVEYQERFADVPKIYLPVMIPRAFLRFRTLSVIGEDLSYTASVLAQGAKVSISGTRVIVDGTQDAGKMPAVEQLVASFGERSVTLSKSEDGVAYEVTVECLEDSNEKCNSDRYASELLNDLVFLGGNSDEPDPQLLTAPSLTSGTPFDAAFKYEAPGILLTNSGQGVKSDIIYAVGIRFPLEKGPAYLNSQVWNYGGNFGPPGNWKDKRNYAYPWRDNFCEKRSRKTPVCPSGTGHQGVDIRPADSRDITHWAVATEDGRITNVGLYSVTLIGKSGSQYRYLHLKMAKLAVKQGARVKRGERIGLVSNDFGGTPTPVHLHFEILQNVDGRGYRHVPPYLSLVSAYKRGN